MAEEFLLQTNDLTKRYKDVLAVDHVNLKLKKANARTKSIIYIILSSKNSKTRFLLASLLEEALPI